MHIRPPRRTDRPYPAASRWRRARGRLLRPMVVASVLLHALLLAFLLVLPPQPPKRDFPPESSFEIVMDGGAKRPTTPGKAPNAPQAAAPGTDTPVAGDQPIPAPAPSQPAPTPAPPPPPAPEVPPAPPAPAPAAPEPPATPSPPTPPSPPAPPVPAPPPRVTLPQPDLPSPVPLPLPPPPPPPAPAPQPPRQVFRPPPRPAPRNPSAFPAPQDWSFGGGLPSRPSRQGASGQAELVGPSQPGPHITGAQLGRDWISSYSAWVQQHLYYPEQAVLNGEDGSTEVVIVINRSGKVLSVQLVGRSGSQWLDLSTTGMFRGAQVPPFPSDTKEDTATIDQTIHYILRRR